MEFKAGDFVILNKLGRAYWAESVHQAFIDRFSGILEVTASKYSWEKGHLWVSATNGDGGGISVTSNSEWFDPAVRFETEEILQDSCHLLPK